jgi:cytidylate kinase
MISFKKGTNVAVVCGGEYDETNIYVNNEDTESDRNLDKADIFDILDDEDFNMNKFKRYPLRDRLKLEKALKQQVEPLDDYLISKYKQISTKLHDKIQKEFEISSGVMIPIPSKESERIFVAGKSGSGKSIFAATYAKEYHLLFPSRKIYIFTKHEKENAYSTINHIEVTCDDELLLSPVDIKILSNSLVIFDDCDHIQDKQIHENVQRLNNDLITTGRKYNIHVMTLCHMLMDYKATRSQLNEANKVVFFNSTSSYHISRYLKMYAGLSKEMIKKIMGIKSRWTMLSVSIPSYVLHEHGIFMI